MHITTLTSPFLLRKYMIEDEALAELVGNRIRPINALKTDTGNFITTTRTAYENDRTKHIETTIVEVELCSPDYDTAVLFMMDALRKIVLHMRNDGHDVDIDDADEYEYAHVEGGQTWCCERAKITLTNISAEVNINEEETD